MTPSKRILIVPVNYNSYDYLDSYLKSVSEAWDMARDECRLTVYIADNSTKPEEVVLSKYNIPDLKIIRLDNPGYFGGALHIINNCLNVDDYDYVIISNVDMTFELSALKSLVNLNLSDDVGWISPYRFSERYNSPIFVEKENRPSKWKIKALMWLFKFPMLHRIQKTRATKRYKTLATENHLRPKRIYSGCGSCFILTKRFFESYPRLHYPLFLYGEEIFIAELARTANLTVRYEPSIRLTNIGEISTGNVNSKTICNYNYKALKYLYNRFFND